MGNPAWGNGYHQGSADGYRSGFGDGSLVGAGLTLAAGALFGGGVWLYKRIKEGRADAHERDLPVEDLTPATDEQGDTSIGG